MSSQRPARSPSPARPTAPAAGEVLTRATLSAAAGALIGSLLLAVGLALSLVVSGEPVYLPGIAKAAGLGLGVLFVLLLPVQLLRQSRWLLDRVFTWLGFTATFFGLAVLAVFFGALILETAHWFEYTPQFVEQGNARVRELHEKIRHTEQVLDAKKAEVLQQMDGELEPLRKQQQDLLAPLSAPQKQALEEVRKLSAAAERLKQKYEEAQDPLRLKERDAQLEPLLRRQQEIAGKFFTGEERARFDEALAAITEENKIRTEYETKFLPLSIGDTMLLLDDYRKQIGAGSERDPSAWAIFWHFLTSGPSYVPQDAGIYPALLGSLWLAAITVLFAVPVGVGAALYLEEYKQNTWLGHLIQININNLAGVPSVVYGILGAFVFVELIFKPIENYVDPAIAARNVLGGGLTLGLLTLPVVIVSAQEAIRAVPSSIRQGAYALGATRWQVIWHQVLPLARPGILTGTILALSRAIGEAAPLVMFGALLFVQQEPSLFSRFTVLPMQIFGWADNPSEKLGDRYVEIWQYNAGLASLVLLLMLLALNAVAIYLRNRAQRAARP